MGQSRHLKESGEPWALSLFEQLLILLVPHIWKSQCFVNTSGKNAVANSGLVHMCQCPHSSINMYNFLLWWIFLKQPITSLNFIWLLLIMVINYHIIIVIIMSASSIVFLGIHLFFSDYTLCSVVRRVKQNYIFFFETRFDFGGGNGLVLS